MYWLRLAVSSNLVSVPLCYDRLGQPVLVGSIVAVPDTKSRIDICRVIGITPKSYRVTTIEGRRSCLKRQDEVICLDEMEATVMYLLTHNI
jgi:hypothetical protein